ncbi:MAG: 3-oxoacyl-ACP synthase, partial [Gammaproteobacteria bacterium]|nr:3-oxoacyl-ACP synthase [Gammaproteobacteria bacterium]
LVLAPRRSQRSLAQWQLAPGAFLSDAPTQLLDDEALELLRSRIPAARCLPLLRSVATQSQRELLLDYLPGRQLALQVAPCL